jgi:hypothetical protein
VASNRVGAKRAIEALRSGVPNRDAVRELGSSHSRIEAAFRDKLSAAQRGERAGGLVVAGEFGSGKSHLLEWLHHVGRTETFVASKVVISKETPLYDAGKVFRTAVDVARLPDRAGAALPEIADRLSERHGTPEYSAFMTWVNDPESGINDRFAASLYLYDQARGDLALRDRIVRFWGGDPITVGELRRELRAIGEGATWLFPRVTDRELALQRFLFVARLIRAAGYAGWALLLDEIELIGRYSLLQRARSYAEVTRWVDPREQAGIPGVAAVLTVSEDFDSAVLDQKGDPEQAPNRLRARAAPGDEELADRAERGIRYLRRENTLRLEPPGEQRLSEINDRIRELHAAAYDWTPPQLSVERREGTRAMRQYIRRWINEWDLRRLDPSYRPDIMIEPLGPDYGEDTNLEPGDDDAGETPAD